MAEEYLDFAQALEALEISETELWELIHSGTLKAYRAGGVIKFKKSDIIAYQKSRGTEPTIVVSRKMLDSMDEQGDDEEGVDTEVGLRAARRPAQDDLATSEVTVRGEAVRKRGSDSEETAPVARRSQKTEAPAARGSVRSKRISTVLETEKKGNPIMNVVMIVACALLIWHGLIQISIASNESITSQGTVKIIKPAWISKGLMESGLKTGAGSNHATLESLIKANGIVFNYEGQPEDKDLLEQIQNQRDMKPDETPEEAPAETPAEPEPAE